MLVQLPFVFSPYFSRILDFGTAGCCDGELPFLPATTRLTGPLLSDERFPNVRWPEPSPWREPSARCKIERPPPPPRSW